MSLASGHTYEPLEEELQSQYNKVFTGCWNDVVRLQPDGWILCKRFLQLQQKIYNFKFRPDDVLVMTYPKCGTTWGQEIVWTMRNNPDLDHPDMKDALFVRSPYIEMDMLMDHLRGKPKEGAEFAELMLRGHEKYCAKLDYEEGCMISIAENRTGGRTLKTHLAMSMFPKNLLDTCKVVYVARNVKDNLLSTLHHYKNVDFHGFVGDLDDFISYYTRGLLLYGPYHTHLKEASVLKCHPNLLMTSFEDLKEDFFKEVRRLDAFVGTALTQQQMLNVQKHTAFSNMKANSTHPQIHAKVEGGFFRKGEAGGWKGKFTPAQETVLDAYIAQHITPLGLDFQHQ